MNVIMGYHLIKHADTTHAWEQGCSLLYQLIKPVGLGRQTPEALDKAQGPRACLYRALL